MGELETALEVTDGTDELGEINATGTEEVDQVDGEQGKAEEGAEGAEGTGDNDTGLGTDSDSGSSDTDDSTIKPKSISSEEFEKLKDDQEEMRQMLRVTRRENATLRAKVGRIDDGQMLDSELDEGEGGEPAQVSRIEELQGSLSDIGQHRGAQLELMAEQMAEMKKYSDIGDVCSKTNVDTIVETAAKILVEKDGGDVEEVMLELEVDIWRRPNPYKYLYDVIKGNHPKYANASTQEKEDSKSQVDKALGNKAASSIQDMGGSGGGKSGGWTADRIDRLPENELNKVPGDVYEKYLQGILK